VTKQEMINRFIELYVHPKDEKDAKRTLSSMLDVALMAGRKMEAIRKPLDSTEW
jgi:hypothetical protein